MCIWPDLVHRPKVLIQPTKYLLNNQFIRSKSDAAKAVIDPATFSRNRQVDACALCHAGLGEPLAPALTFKPGDTLGRYLRIPEADPVIPVDVHGNQVQLLKRSRCYQSSNMTCSTCHNVHQEQHDVAALSTAISTRRFSFHRDDTVRLSAIQK